MIIQSTHVWIDDCLQPAQLEIADGLIQAVLPYGEKQPDHDYQELWILPVSYTHLITIPVSVCWNMTMF